LDVLALPHIVDACEPERTERALDGFPLWVEHTGLEGDLDAGFHIGSRLVIRGVSVGGILPRRSGSRRRSRLCGSRGRPPRKTRVVSLLGRRFGPCFDGPETRSRRAGPAGNGL